MRLNPFDFRALLLQLYSKHLRGEFDGLNPFDFRALLLPKSRNQMTRPKFVLIPLISGLCYYPLSRRYM